MPWTALLFQLGSVPASDDAPTRPWRNERLRGTPENPPEMTAVRAYPNLSIKHPVAIEREPGTDRILVLENHAWDVYRSILKRFPDRPDAGELETLLEIPGDSEVAYGICFHPCFQQNGWLYIGSNGIGPGPVQHSRIVRHTMQRAAPWKLVQGSAQTILQWPSNGHNGAAAVFGNDGMLYVTTGDGTANSDVGNSGQDTGSLLAKVLRIDVDGSTAAQPYRVPPDNPFVGNSAVRPETWAYGLRNPWRITCDAMTGQIWIGQNGQDLREYAHLLERGANYGWSEFEGSRPFLKGRLRGPSPFTPPTIEHDHAVFRSLTGGFVYRGEKFPHLQGAYLYGDYGTGRVWAARHDGRRLLWNRELTDSPLAIAGFGTNASGDILLADHLGNALWKLVPTPPPAAGQRPFPQQLSDTNLFSSTEQLLPAEGVIGYEINAPGWHDGAFSNRMLAMHDLSSAELPPQNEPAWPWKSWTFPDGTALVQTLTLPATKTRPTRRIETRILLRQDADWFGYSYVWNDAQTDARLAPKEGRHLVVAGQEWNVPARSDCVLCHARGANYALGLTTAQLNRMVKHRGGNIHQLELFSSRALVRAAAPAASPWPKPPADLPRLADPNDATASLEERVRSYLAVNCSHCHRHEGGGNSRMDLSPWLDTGAQHLIDAAPQHGDYGMPDARIICPGDAGRSVLPVRLTSRGAGQMPPVGSSRIDPQGTSLILQWLASLTRPQERK